MVTTENIIWLLGLSLFVNLLMSTSFFLYIGVLKDENQRMAENLLKIALTNAKWAEIYAKNGFPVGYESDEDQ